MRLERTAGYNLQHASILLNNRTAVNVARPSKWGNPYKVGVPVQSQCGINTAILAGIGRDEWTENRPTTNEMAVTLYRHALQQGRINRGHALTELRGRNLACWCKKNEMCHADILLSMANDRTELRADGDRG